MIRKVIFINDGFKYFFEEQGIDNQFSVGKILRSTKFINFFSLHQSKKFK